MPTYSHVQSKHPSPVKIDGGWLKKNRGTLVCDSCNSLIGEGPVDLAVTRIEDSPINISVPVAVGVIRLDLLSALGEEAARELHIGRLVEPSGKSLEDFFTFRGRNPVRIWGDNRSEEKSCSSCGADHYYPTGRWCIRPDELSGRMVCESIFSQLVVCDELLAELCEDELRDISIMPLSIRA
jgi:hypothetical protein